jgi:YVTN family beta-propeller protein
MALICVPIATIVQEDIKPMRTSRIASPLVGIVLIVALAACGSQPSNTSPTALPKPQVAEVKLGDLPAGGALTADGRFLWTVSAGVGSNDVRIVDTASHRVIQVVNLPGASGGIALDSAHQLAYVSGLPNSRWQPSKNGLAGARGDDVLVYSWSPTSGMATLARVIPVPPPAGAPVVQTFPLQRSTSITSTKSWPQNLTVSTDGSQLLVPLNLADNAALIDLNNSDRVQYVPTGGYPFGAAIVPDGSLGLVTNEAAGTLSFIDMKTGAKEADLAVGPPLSHPEGVIVDAAGARAYVAMANEDQVVVVDLKTRQVERTISVGRSNGLGTMPVALALSPNNDRLFVAESGANEVAVIRLPNKDTASNLNWSLVGRIPVDERPQVVATVAAHGSSPAQLMWVSAKGVNVGAFLNGPNPTTIPIDPIFWSFNPVAPTTDIFNGIDYLGNVQDGKAGIMALPSDSAVASFTPAATRLLQPATIATAPSDTVLRANGPIKHVFFVVRENRTYDQLLGDVSRGNGDPKLTVFGGNTTPNLHALVSRFPLMDNVMANSEASIDGHYVTSSASIPNYVARNWPQNYAGRGRPTDFGVYSVSWPGNGFLFDQAKRQSVSYYNYGEGVAGNEPNVPDRNLPAAQLPEVQAKAANSDLGPGLTPGGCYPTDLTIGTALDNGEIFDSTLPAGAPAGSYSHMSCFDKRFATQLSQNAVPALNYISLTSDHTRGTQPGYPVPTAMVADSDQALGQLVDTISHSSIWASSAIFVMEDDSQDGADHVDAHRIPVAVISPYAKKGAVIHTLYDQLSMVRSMELILGMHPLGLDDAMANPMYDAFTATPDNSAPVTAIPSKVNLLERNTTASANAALSSSLPLGEADQVPQAELDAIIWHSVYGAGSMPPPAGPNANSKQ